MPQYVLKPTRLIKERPLIPFKFFRYGDAYGYIEFNLADVGDNLTTLLENCDDRIVIMPPLTPKTINKDYIYSDCILEVDCARDDLEKYTVNGGIPANKLLAIHQKTRAIKRDATAEEEFNFAEYCRNGFLAPLLTRLNTSIPALFLTSLKSQLAILEHSQLKHLLKLMQEVQPGKAIVQKDAPSSFTSEQLKAAQRTYRLVKQPLTWGNVLDTLQEAIKERLAYVSRTVPKFTQDSAEPSMQHKENISPG